MQIRKRIIASVAIVGTVLMSIGLGTVATAQPSQTNTQRIAILETQVAKLNAAVFLPITPGPTATITVKPTTKPTVTVTATVAPSATPNATATPPVATPIPPTAMPGMVGVCGESLMVWHAPVINGCATGHEHGRPPPDWVMSSPRLPMFVHAHSTSVLEDTAKHPFMKGYSWTDQQKSCLTGYTIQHGAGMGMERIAQFHSTQTWIKDCSGNVSYLSHWSDFGVPALYPAGDRVFPANFDQIHAERANEGIIRVPTVSNDCEQWYPESADNKPDVSLLICGSPEYFNMDEITNPSGEFLMENITPDLSGGLGLFRQLDFVWPLDRMQGGDYLTDQFGRQVTTCPANVQYDGQTYPALCAQWHIAPSLIQDVQSKSPDFGTRRIFAIARDENIPGPGVHAPN